MIVKMEDKGKWKIQPPDGSPVWEGWVSHWKIDGKDAQTVVPDAMFEDLNLTQADRVKHEKQQLTEAGFDADAVFEELRRSLSK